MRSTCTEPSFPTSVSGVWLSVLLFVFMLVSVLQSAEAGKVASGAVG